MLSGATICLVEVGEILLFLLTDINFDSSVIVSIASGFKAAYSKYYLAH
jgi:hypothetical protein